jgi:hypothetical protein
MPHGSSEVVVAKGTTHRQYRKDFFFYAVRYPAAIISVLINFSFDWYAHCGLDLIAGEYLSKRRDVYRFLMTTAIILEWMGAILLIWFGGLFGLLVVLILVLVPIVALATYYVADWIQWLEWPPHGFRDCSNDRAAAFLEAAAFFILFVYSVSPRSPHPPISHQASSLA